MSNPFASKKPSAALQWLARSVAWATACGAALALIIWRMERISSSDKGAHFVFQCILTLVQVVLWKKAVGGFDASMRQHPTAALGPKVLAASWLFLLIGVLLLCAWFTALTAFGWLMLGDDGRSWSV